MEGCCYRFIKIQSKTLFSKIPLYEFNKLALSVLSISTNAIASTTLVSRDPHKYIFSTQCANHNRCIYIEEHREQLFELLHGFLFDNFSHFKKYLVLFL